MVIRSEYRMEQYGDDEHREEASHFTLLFISGPGHVVAESIYARVRLLVKLLSSDLH